MSLTLGIEYMNMHKNCMHFSTMGLDIFNFEKGDTILLNTCPMIKRQVNI